MATKTPNTDPTGYGLKILDAPLFSALSNPKSPVSNPRLKPLPTAVSTAAFASASRRLHILRYLAAVENATLDEICQALEVTPNQISGRISDLKRDLLLEETGQYRPSRSGCASMVYQLTGRGRDYLLKTRISRSL